MKNKITVLILVSFLTLLYGCSKTEDGSYTPPITVYEKIPGTWKLLSIKMIDETAKAAGIKPDEMLLTDHLNFQDFAITLNVDAENKPTTYVVNGNVPELLSPEGYWDLDAEFPFTTGVPIKISLYSDAARTQKTNQLSITSMPGSKSEMELKLTHTSNQVAFVTYLYNLILVAE